MSYLREYNFYFPIKIAIIIFNAMRRIEILKKKKFKEKKRIIINALHKNLYHNNDSL